MDTGPLLSCCYSLALVFLPALRHVSRQRVVGVGSTEECLDGQEDSSDLQGRGPVVLEHIQADPAQLVDVWMVDLGEEADLGRDHGVVVRQEELELEDASLVW